MKETFWDVERDNFLFEDHYFDGCSFLRAWSRLNAISSGILLCPLVSTMEYTLLGLYQK
jgi:hypothetical protein